MATTLFIFNFNLHNQDIFERHEKRAEEQDNLFEGDIELTAEQRAIIDESTEPGSNSGERKARSDLTKRWPNAQVPYVIASAPGKHLKY